MKTTLSSAVSGSEQMAHSTHQLESTDNRIYRCPSLI